MCVDGKRSKVSIALHGNLYRTKHVVISQSGKGQIIESARQSRAFDARKDVYILGSYPVGSIFSDMITNNCIL